MPTLAVLSFHGLRRAVVPQARGGPGTRRRGDRRRDDWRAADKREEQREKLEKHGSRRVGCSLPATALLPLMTPTVATGPAAVLPGWLAWVLRGHGLLPHMRGR